MDDSPGRKSDTSVSSSLSLRSNDDAFAVYMRAQGVLAKQGSKYGRIKQRLESELRSVTFKVSLLQQEIARLEITLTTARSETFTQRETTLLAGAAAVEKFHHLSSELQKQREKVIRLELRLAQKEEHSSGRGVPELGPDEVIWKKDDVRKMKLKYRKMEDKVTVSYARCAELELAVRESAQTEAATKTESKKLRSEIKRLTQVIEQQRSEIESLTKANQALHYQIGLQGPLYSAIPGGGEEGVYMEVGGSVIDQGRMAAAREADTQSSGVESKYKPKTKRWGWS